MKPGNETAEWCSGPVNPGASGLTQRGKCNPGISRRRQRTGRISDEAGRKVGVESSQSPEVKSRNKRAKTSDPLTINIDPLIIDLYRPRRVSRIPQRSQTWEFK